MSYPMPKSMSEMPPNAEPTVDWAPSQRHRAHVIVFLSHRDRWRRGVEIGCGDGRTSEKILRGNRSLKLMVVDPWEGQFNNTGPENWVDWPHEQHEELARSRLKRFGDRCEIFRGYSAEAAELVTPGELDFVFVDGDHSRSAVTEDIYMWRKKIRPGGMLLGHDINWPSVRSAVSSCFSEYFIAQDNVWGVQL